MKKVLILAYEFPPYLSVGGFRPYSWYKYLLEFGVHPIIITRQWNNKHGNYLDYISASESPKIITEDTEKGTIIRAPYKPNLANRIMLKYGDKKHKMIRRSISAYHEITQFLFPTGPKSSLYYTAEKYLKNNKVDAIIASGDPFILFKYASKLSKKYNTPWIADYRDAWSHDLSCKKNILLRNIYPYFEKKIVSTSSEIITVSHFLKAQISELIKNKKISVLPNGYDPELINDSKKIQQERDCLNIAFVGSIFIWNPIKSFLSVVSKFVNNNQDAKIKINFYGINIPESINSFITNDFPNLKEHIFIFPKMSNDLILKELAKNNLMLLFNYYSYMGTKIFDYIGVQRKILLCYANDSEAQKLKEENYDIEEIEGLSKHLQEDLIKETKAGYVVQDAQHLLKILDEVYTEFNTKGYIPCHSINTENYSRKYQVEQMAKIIKDINQQPQELQL